MFFCFRPTHVRGFFWHVHHPVFQHRHSWHCHNHKVVSGGIWYHFSFGLLWRVTTSLFRCHNWPVPMPTHSTAAYRWVKDFKNPKTVIIRTFITPVPSRAIGSVRKLQLWYLNHSKRRIFGHCWWPQLSPVRTALWYLLEVCKLSIIIDFGHILGSMVICPG